MKQCKGCSLTKALSEFYKHKNMADGHLSTCKECKKAYQSTISHKYAEQRRFYARAQKQEKSEYDKQYRKRFPEKKRHSSAKRRAAILQRTPKWADMVYIKDLYENVKEAEEVFGTKFHVDHIVPLQGLLVSGLHCEDNLQVLRAKDNMAKGNKYV